jgi:signal transduction histidine kinase
MNTATPVQRVYYAGTAHAVAEPDRANSQAPSDEAVDNGGMGLINMRERTEKLQGVFTLESAPGQGVKIRVQIPIAPTRGTYE